MSPKYRVRMMRVALVILWSILVISSTFSVGGWAAVQPARASTQSVGESDPLLPFARELGCATSLQVLTSSYLNLTLTTSTCQLNSTVSLSNSSESGQGPALYSISYALAGIGEVSPSGQIVQYTSPSGFSVTHWSHNYSAGTLNLDYNAVAAVTRASGSWNPSTFTSGSLSQQAGTVGNVSAEMYFHLQISPANVTELKFGAEVAGWPWASDSDHLGLLFSGMTEPGATFAWNSEDQNLTEILNGSTTPFAGLQLESHAVSTSSSGVTTVENVTSDAGIYTVGTTSQGADLLVNFTGGNGGYSELEYDPWVVFSLPARSAAAGPLLDLAALIALAAGGSVAVALAVVARRARQRAPEAGLSRAGSHPPTFKLPASSPLGGSFRTAARAGAARGN